MDVRELGAIFAGGCAGALARVGLDRAFPAAAAHWPWVTFAVNVSGCLVLGWVAARLAARRRPSAGLRSLLATGLCGAYTTFSTMALEVLVMLRHDRYALAAGYAAASIGAGYLAIWLGGALVRRARAIA
jgi:CrcB protein